MTRAVSVDEFLAGPAPLLERVSRSGEALVILREGTAVALLTPPPTASSSATAGASRQDPLGGWEGLPRWEHWLDQMRKSFAEPVAGPGPAEPAPAPTVLDKARFGYEPTGGGAGTEAGRRRLAGDLERLGVPVPDARLLGEIHAALLALCGEKEHLYEDDLRVLALDAMAGARRGLRLLALTVSSTTGQPATAEVTLELERGPAMRREQGDGPLDAAFKAIQRLSGLDPAVENFSLVAATPGADAVAEAVIELRWQGRRVVGRGASTNAVEAGVRAYVTALNLLREHSGG